MFQSHQANTFRHIFRLLKVQGKRLSRQGIAETAGTGTDLPADQEGCRPPAPTFPHVRAFSARADRMQAMRLHDAFRLREPLVPAQAYLQPIRLSQMTCHRLSLQVIEQIVRHLRIEMIPGIATEDTMVPILIDVHIELLVRLHQRLGVRQGLHEVDVIIGSPMH